MSKTVRELATAVKQLHSLRNTELGKTNAALCVDHINQFKGTNMNYQKISGGVVLYRTGEKHTVDKLKIGFANGECDPLDAPDCIAAGSMYVIEFNDKYTPVRYWFDAQKINLR